MVSTYVVCSQIVGFQRSNVVASRFPVQHEVGCAHQLIQCGASDLGVEPSSSNKGRKPLLLEHLTVRVD